jgi:hypothetical protein
VKFKASAVELPGFNREVPGLDDEAQRVIGEAKRLNYQLRNLIIYS